MASEWFCIRDGQKRGPFSSQQLLAMVKSGQLLPTDLLWKQGMAAGKPAGDVKQLFPSTSKPPTPTPPLPAAASAKPAPVVSDASVPQSFKATARTAAQATQLAAERTKINTVTIPSAYLQLGKHCYATRAFASDFLAEFSKLDQLAQSVAVQEADPGAPPPTTFSERAKALAGKGVDFAKRQKAALDQALAFKRLGQAAFEKHGSAAGPSEIVTAIRSALDRIAALDQQLAGCKASLRTNGVPQKKLLFGSIAAVAALVVGIVGYGVLSGGGAGEKRPPQSSKASRRPGAKGPAVQTPDIPDVAGMVAGVRDDVARIGQQNGGSPGAEPSTSVASDPTRPSSTPGTAVGKKQQQARDLSQWRGTQEKDVPTEYLTGPNGEMIEDLYEEVVEPHGKYINLIRGYLAGQVVPPEEAIWQGRRQPILEAAKRDGRFVSHGQRITWTAENAPPLPDRHAQARAFAASESPPALPVLPAKRRIVDFWKEGKCEGEWREYHPDGTLKAQVAYVDGNREGPFIAYWPSGKKKLEEQWVNGVRMGTQKGWHENGQQAVEGEFVNGKPEGTWVWWYANGRKQAEQTLRDGKREGTWHAWYENGQLWAEDHYENGLNEGDAFLYWESGQKKIRLVYKSGKVQEGEGWDSDGKPLERAENEPMPKTLFDWGVCRGRSLAKGLNRYIEKLGWEKSPELWKKAFRDVAEESVLDAERTIREYSHIPNASDNSRGFLKGFTENYKYNAQ